MISRDQISVANKLYECQETAKKLYKEEYQEKIQWYKDVIKGWNSTNGTDTLESVLQICQRDTIRENGMATLLFMAAAVEIIEPSSNTSPNNG